VPEERELVGGDGFPTAAPCEKVVPAADALRLATTLVMALLIAEDAMADARA
jgi:hypothetical protein